MVRGHAPLSCSTVMYGGHVARSCSDDMSRGHVPMTCSEVMLRVARNGCSWHWPWHQCDTLLVGTPANFLASDAEKTSDLFYKDVSDRATFGRQKKNIRKLCRISPSTLPWIFIKVLLLNKFRVEIGLKSVPFPSEDQVNSTLFPLNRYPFYLLGHTLSLFKCNEL